MNRLFAITILVLASVFAAGCGDSVGDRIDCGSMRSVETQIWDVIVDRQLPHDLIVDALQEWSDRTCGAVAFRDVVGTPASEPTDVPSGQYHIQAVADADGHAALTWSDGLDGIAEGAAYTRIRWSQKRESNYQRVALHEFGHVVLGAAFGGDEPWHYYGAAESVMDTNATQNPPALARASGVLPAARRLVPHPAGGTVTRAERILAVELGWQAECAAQKTPWLAEAYKVTHIEAATLPNSLRACADIGRTAMREELAILRHDLKPAVKRPYPGPPKLRPLGSAEIDALIRKGIV